MNELETIVQYCPYCGESIDLFIDCSVPSQNYIEDCSVCCQPINVSISIDGGGDPIVEVKSENE